ncbi:PPC domain-containing protein [Aggregatilinea lenta]|uniref:PPC domain-containing protein n=1 Tax=Aggregatilinea lenta TaxID=913108 RepID=UPI0013C36975|nr:PPC domain-containing protein [Aggregatilinea lenta]
MTQLDQNLRSLRPAGLLAVGLALCVTVVLSLVLVSGMAFAQGDQSRQLTVGDVVSGTLDSDVFVQVYTFVASTGDTISVDVTTEVEDLGIVLLVADQNGNIVAQDADASTSGASVADLAIETDGTYFIQVLRASGAEGDVSGDFELELSGTIQLSGDTVTLQDGGIAIDLTWAEAVDLNLEVRDPVGGTVHAFSPTAPSGGSLSADVNGECQDTTADNPTETVSWPVGEVPAGSYEIIVHYFDACGIGGPQEFQLDATVNSGTTQSIPGTLNPTQEYLARLIVEPNGSWTLDNGGVNAGLDVSLFSAEVADADPIAVGTTVSGTITNAEPAQAYTFDGTTGTPVNIALQAQSGSLDTYVALLGPDNTLVASNDDAGDSTNSGIDFTLGADGTYTIIATRYALAIGGTEGDFTLSLTTGTAETPTDTTGTPVPAATAADAGETTALTPGSIEVELTWPTNADLQLNVRDPNGDTVYDDEPEIASGGLLESVGNQNCTDTTNSPVSYIYWPANRSLLPGTYEVEVWYQDNCSDNTPVNIALRVDVGGQTIINTPQQIPLNAHFMITFTIDQSGTATAGNGGFFDMSTANTLNYQNQLDSATPVQLGSTVSGSITQDQPFELYSFEADAGDVVDITMTATGGTLDTALFLIAPNGFQAAYNDDIAVGENRNSAITETTLSSSGTYTIIATHYGLNLGGTTGTYTLSLSQP